jgi:hypothetical protein
MKPADLPRTRELVEAKRGGGRESRARRPSFNAGVSSEETPHQRNEDGSRFDGYVECIHGQACLGCAGSTGLADPRRVAGR